MDVFTDNQVQVGTDLDLCSTFFGPNLLSLIQLYIPDGSVYSRLYYWQRVRLYDIVLFPLMRCSDTMYLLWVVFK